MRRSYPHHCVFLRLLFGVVIANYLAQIVYYLHLYFFPRKAMPSLPGTILLALTCVWFLLGYVGTVRGRLTGYWLLFTYLLTEVSFYSMNLLNQVTHGYAPFFHLQTRDPILFVVFGIGYLNLLTGAFALYYLLRHRHALLATGSAGAARDGIR